MQGNKPAIGSPTDEQFHDLDVLEDVGHPDVPEKRMYMRRQIEATRSYTDLQIVCSTIQDPDFSTLLVGRHGVGKDEMILHIANQTNRPVMRVSANDDPEFVSLLTGNYKPRENGFEFVDGMLKTAIEDGYMFVMDEFNSLSGKVQTMLNMILEDSHKSQLTIPETNQVVEPHPEFRFIATMNPDEIGYVGREKLDGATSSRFYPIEIPELGRKAEKRVVAERVDWDTDNERLENLLSDESPVQKLRERYKENRTVTWISTRDVIQIARMAQNLDDLKSAIGIIIRGRAPEEDKDAIETVLKDVRF